MNLAELPPTLTVSAAAEILGISRNTCYMGVARGQIPAIKIVGRWVVPTARLLSMLGVGDRVSEATSTLAGSDLDAETQS